MTAARPLLLGHRGARKRAAENTLPAFDLALQYGCDGFEFDVRLTSDSQAIVCHDDRLSGVYVAKETYAGLLQRSGTLMPCLQDVLRRYQRTAFLDIELKVPGLELALLQGIEDYPPERGFVVSSFLPDILLDLRRRNASVPLGFICDSRKLLDGWETLPVEYVIAQYGLAGSELIAQVHAAGRKVFVWTVNREAEMRRMAELGVDAIISDDTEVLSRVLSRRGR